MMQVPIIVIEDTAIRQEDYQQIGLPTSRSNFEFIGHSSLENKTWIITRQTFDNYCQFLSGKEVPGWGKLSGLAIIIADLGLDIALNSEEINCLQKLRKYKDQNTPELESDQLIGCCAIAKALENPNWSGVIVVASTRGRHQAQVAMIAQLFACFPERKKDVLIEITQDAISTPRYARRVIDLAIEKFMSKFGLEERLWPSYTEKWFDTQEFNRDQQTVPVPHNWTDLKNQHQRDNCVNAIKKYLTDLLLFEPPSVWFESEKFQYLFEDLKHLIGSNSVFQGKSARTLTLGNVILLLAAATGDNSQNWMKNIVWQQKYISLEILPKQQTKEDARDAVLILAEELFPFLSRNRHKENSPPLVEKVQLFGDSSSLKITLDADFSQRTQNDRPSLIEKVQTLPDNDGDVYTGYRKFLLASAKTQRGREALCVVNLFVENGKSILEFRKCRT
jgi:hypothetical protein